MEQLGTATNRASGLSLESAFLCSLYAQAVRGDHALLPDGMRPVVLQRDNSQNRTAAPGSSADAEATPEGSTTSAQTPAPGTAASLGSISINPGYAPLIVPHHSGHGSRFRMPAGMRSSVSVSGGPGQMEMFMSSPATDPAASDIIEEMLASGMISGATVRGLFCSCGPCGSLSDIFSYDVLICSNQIDSDVTFPAAACACRPCQCFLYSTIQMRLLRPRKKRTQVSLTHVLFLLAGGRNSRSTRSTTPW